MSNIYLVCPNHGQVFVHKGGTLGSAPDYRKLEPVINGIGTPKATDEYVCPLCREDFSVEFESD
jgi:hypothetical protein